MMRALALTDWWKLRVVTVDDPEPGAAEVSIEVIATGICGSDIHGFTGENGRRQHGQIMGHETVGRIVEVGSEVDETALPVGTLVTVNPVLACGECEQCEAGRDQACPNKTVMGVTPSIVSAFAERIIVPARNAVPLPSTMPVEYGALVEPLAVGYHALRRGSCAPGEPVLIIGGGPIGQACALAALRIGASPVIVSEPDSHRRELLARLGAQVVDPMSDDDFDATVIRAAGRRPELVVDAVGNTVTLRSAASIAAYGARIVLVGMGQKNVDLSAFEVSTKERTLIGSFCYTAEEFRDTAAWVGTAPEELAELVDARVGLDGAEECFTSLAQGTNPASKVLVFLQEDLIPAP
jgi:2-desacetyl-2-hydroxyethyl bacteriochlorophyllide A dehydrogenase